VFILSASKWKVIDGQQRLATLCIFVSVIRDILLENGKSVPKKFEDYLYDSSTARVELNEVNKEFFRDYLIKKSTDLENEKIKKMKEFVETSTPSDQRLFDAYQYIYDRIITEWTDKSKTSFLTDLVSILFNSFKVIIVIAEHNEAHLVFETLNERGTRLTHSDLVKNYLIRKAGASDADNVYRKWKKAMENIVDKPDVFLRHYCIANYGQTSESEIYRKIREKNPEKTDVIRFADSVKKSSEIYKELKKPTGGYWQSRDIVSDLNEIRDLSSIVFYPLLMLAREKEGNVIKFLHLLRICVSLFVRYKTIVGLHYTKLEKLTIAACELIRNNESITSSRIKQLFKDIYPNDVIFESAFRVHSQNDNKIARYLLVKICRMYEYDTAPEDTITLEHVIPVAMRKYRGVVYGNKPDNIKEWDKYMRTHGLNYTEIYRLGNMALLLPKDNEQVKDKTFKEKKKIYKRSSISFTKNISKFSKWDLSTISKRQDELAKKAKTTWKINF